MHDRRSDVTAKELPPHMPTGLHWLGDIGREKHGCVAYFENEAACLAFMKWLEGKFMTDAQIKRMTERFLAWTLPSDFSPDGGISYAQQQPPWLPTGTNLFTYTQAEAMVRHMIVGEPAHADELDRLAGEVERLREENLQAKAYSRTLEKLSEARARAALEGIPPEAGKGCAHEGYSFKRDGRCCPKCGTFMVDFGD